MLGGLVRTVVCLVMVTVVVSGCMGVFSTSGSEPSATRRPVPTRPQPTASSPSAPSAATPSTPVQPTQVPEPTSLAGPPFPRPMTDVAVYDLADVFSPATEERAASQIAEIEQRQDSRILVFTQHKPGSDAASTERDARALMVQWGVRNGLVIMWNTTRVECAAGTDGNGQVQLYAGARYAALHLSEAERQEVFDHDMLPFLRECKEDDALLAALEGIHAVADAAPPPAASRPPGAASGACADSAYELAGFHWSRPFQWHFQESSVPDQHEADDVLDVLRRSASNVTEGRNDCGLPDKIDAIARYGGTTTLEPCVADTADGYNTVGFGELPEDMPPDTLAMVCTYGGRDVVVEADILIVQDIPWALSEEECEGFEEILEATITHEFGHVFGLSHVSERQHGDLTMSPTSNGPCDAEEITLGLGDILGLEQLY